MDEAKNMALLFFVDHLMQKGGQRTIHDLSCQFGARGFTEEMRQAVGTTQEGLTEFLAQFPSLFTLDGDQISLKGFGEVEGTNHLSQIPPSGRQRDYVAEAVQFFVAKLEKFGPELQIKSLLGHRSQAAPEVRLCSGRHLKEFAEFLAAQVDHFIVEADRVRLRNMPEPKATRPDEFLDEEGRPLAGHRAKLAVIEFLRGVLEQNEDVPIPLDTFYRRFCERFPHHIRQEVATNPKELLMFLKLNRHVFFIRSNKVQLVRTRPGDELGDSESGRSTEDGASDEQRSVASPEQNGHFVAATQSPKVLFPLNRENMHRVQLVRATKQAEEVVRALLADLSACPRTDLAFLAVDFKLVSMGAYQEQFLALVVLASAHRLAVFDLAHSEGILLESGLSDLLEDERVLKAAHDVRRVVPVLGNRYGIRMHNVFDTQIAHSVIQHDKFGKPLGELRAISFVNLQRVYFPQSLVMSDVSPRKLSQTPNWADRPLSAELLLSSCEECHCLASGLFRLLNSQLPAQHRTLFGELCADALKGEQRNSGAMPALQQNSLERKVTPLLELPMNGIYRPPSRRRSMQQQNGGLFSPPLNGGGYVPPPLRKVSAPPSQQGPVGGGTSPFQHRSATYCWPKAETREMGTQTLSTGEITLLKVYYDEEQAKGQRNGEQRETDE